MDDHAQRRPAAGGPLPGREACDSKTLRDLCRVIAGALTLASPGRAADELAYVRTSRDCARLVAGACVQIADGDPAVIDVAALKADLALQAASHIESYDHGSPG